MVSANLNANGQAYVVYLFAHDTSAEGVIQCGMITSGGQMIELGWEPQFLLRKSLTGGSYWYMIDDQRGWSKGPGSNNTPVLGANAADPEASGGTFPLGYKTSTGFYASYVDGQEIFMAIRKAGS